MFIKIVCILVTHLFFTGIFIIYRRVYFVADVFIIYKCIYYLQEYLLFTSVLLFADVFHTRIAPSKMYDVLKDDFDYLFIGGVTIGMIVISFVSRHFALRKQVKRAWK